ncbi:MAG: penicillin-binding protein 1C [Bacteroidales bacterium]|nr:penicillin-binding protein 1C [Bacteroidales bacterium]
MKLKHTISQLKHLATANRRRKIISSSIFAIVSTLILFKLIIIITPVSKKRLSGYNESVRIFDRKGKLLRESVSKKGARAEWINFEDISPHVINTTLAAEDKRFYNHHGIDYYAVTRAIKQIITHQRIVSGASTISMQLARVLYDHSHAWYGKLGQAFNAKRIERTLDKNEILEQYLNRVFYGAGAIGIEAAGKQYFGKPNQHLSLAEASLIAGLTQAPSRYNPFKNFEQAKNRQKRILENLLKNNLIDNDEYDRALNEAIILKRSANELYAMHFTDYVLANIEHSGDIHTTIDMDLQVRIEKMVTNHVQSYQAGGLTNASVVILDNISGDIISMVGSADYWNDTDGSVNGALSLRQPGSALKPFTYALAFERGKTPASIVPDIETEYIGRDGDLYIPRNYSEKFYGPVMIKHALGRSLNIASIRTLNFVGIDTLLQRLKLAGISTLNEDADFYGLGLTLGNGEVTLLELAQAYSAFARKGKSCKARYLLQTKRESSTKVFSEEICFLITDILSDEKLRIQAFGSANPLLFDFPIAIKTGTSANFRDNWVVGYTDKYTIAIWAGDFTGEPMNQFSGSVGAGPLFNKITNLVIKHYDKRYFPQKPELIRGMQKILVCPLSGKTPTIHCPNYESITTLIEEYQRAECHVHQLLKIDKRNGLLASDHCPSKYTEEKVFEVLSSTYSQWQSDNNRDKPPLKYSPYCMPDQIASNALVITSPLDGDIFLLEPGYNPETQSIALKGESNPALPYVDWFVDGEKYTRAEWPYTSHFKLKKGKHTIEMVKGDMRSDKVEIEVR